MPTEQDILALAQQQGLDPEILQLAMQSMQAPAAPMMAAEEVAIGSWLTPWDVYKQSALYAHAQEMLPLLQAATQDEVMGFIKEIIELYMWD